VAVQNGEAHSYETHQNDKAEQGASDSLYVTKQAVDNLNEFGLHRITGICHRNAYRHHCGGRATNQCTSRNCELIQLSCGRTFRFEKFHSKTFPFYRTYLRVISP